MPAGQLMGLDDHPLPHSQGLAHTMDRPLFQGSTLGGNHTHLVNASPPHHDVGSEVRVCAVLALLVTPHHVPGFIICHHSSSFVITHHRLRKHAKKLQQVTPTNACMHWCTLPMTSWQPRQIANVVQCHLGVAHALLCSCRCVAAALTRCSCVRKQHSLPCCIHTV